MGLQKKNTSATSKNNKTKIFGIFVAVLYCKKNTNKKYESIFMGQIQRHMTYNDSKNRLKAKHRASLICKVNLE